MREGYYRVREVLQGEREALHAHKHVQCLGIVG